MSASHISQELDPLVRAKLADKVLVLLVDLRKLKRVEEQLLHVSQGQVPCDVGRNVVVGRALRVPEAFVVRADAHLHSLREQASCRVAPEILLVSKNKVGDGAALNAKIFLFDELNQLGVFSKRKTMANPLTSHQYRIIELLVASAIAFTSVEQHLELTIASLLSGQDLLQKVVDAFIVVFFVDHVEGADHVVLIIIVLLNLVEHSLDMALAQHFKATDDDLHFKQGESGLDQFLGIVENLEFAVHTDRTILVQETAEDVSELNEGDELFDVVFARSV